MSVRALILWRIALVFAGLLAGVWIAGSAAVSASAGIRVDRRFGGGRGYVTSRIPGTDAVVYGAIVLPGGKIVVAGQASPPSGDGQIVVARYLRNGRLDRRFGSGGVFESAFPTADAPFLADAIARDRRTGKLVVAGGYGLGSMLVMRLTPGGRLDPTFGAHRSGFATVAVGGIANALAIQLDGRILLGGSNSSRPGRPFVVVRFTRNGTLDHAFGHRGVAQELFWNPSAGSGAGLSLVPTRDGGVIAGHIDYNGGTGGASGGHGSAGVFRLTRSGRPSRAFGTRGHVQITFFTRAREPESWYPCAMTTDGRGRILVTGGGGTRRSALLTARLTSRGVLDRTYGSSANGRATTPGVGGNAITTCGATSTRGGVLTVGVQSRVAQLLPNGLPNRRFARGGVARIDRPARVFINALIPSGPRRSVMAGSAGNAIYLSRYLFPTAPPA